MTDQSGHRRRSALGGITVGTLIAIIFAGVIAVCSQLIWNLHQQVITQGDIKDANKITMSGLDYEIAAREADIEDLEHFLPSHGRPPPNPPSTNPMNPPQQHD